MPEASPGSWLSPLALFWSKTREDLGGHEPGMCPYGSCGHKAEGDPPEHWAPRTSGNSLGASPASVEGPGRADRTTQTGEGSRGLINVYKCLMGGMKGRRRVQALPSGVLSALSTEGQGLNDFGVEAAQAPAATATTLKPSSSPLCTCEPRDMSSESF